MLQNQLLSKLGGNSPSLAAGLTPEKQQTNGSQGNQY